MATCIDEIPALASDIPCPTYELQARADEQLRQLLTIPEKCPKCKSDGYDVKVKPFVVQYPLMDGRITHFDIEIIRSCGHYTRKFSIGF